MLLRTLLFLAMDLDFQSRSDLANHFIEHYIVYSGDKQLTPLLPFYKCYRAYVRGKVISFKIRRPQHNQSRKRICNARLLDLPFEQMPEINRQFFGGDRVDFSLIALIQRLRPTYTTALLSNTWNVHLENTLRESLKITDTFDVIISSAAEGIAKPDPRIYQIALEKVNCSLSKQF